jgi:hypothetical protein
MMDFDRPIGPQTADEGRRSEATILVDRIVAAPFALPRGGLFALLSELQDPSGRASGEPLVGTARSQQPSQRTGRTRV